MNVELIALTAVHAELAAAIHRRCFAEPWTPSAMTEMLGMPGSFGWIAGEGYPVGLILCRGAADEVEVITLGVLPAARGRGVAGRLLDAAMTAAREAGAAAAFLEVAEENAAALALYRGRGFCEVGRRPNYYGPQRHALILRREL
jgi:ribosomal-protein-alanine N-acetyltransferase